MKDLKELWQMKSDDEIREAAERLSDYTNDAQQVIRSEMSRRGIPDLSPSAGKLSVKPSGTLFLYIPVARLILLSIVSFSLYEAYWVYKNWRFIKERNGLNIRPFWRGIFGVFFCHSLLREIHGDKEARAFVEPSFSPGGLATGWVILLILGNLIGRAPGIVASIIAAVMPSYLCLVPIQNYINSVTKRQSPSAIYHGWSSGHIMCIVIGIIVWGLILFGGG